MTPDKRSYCSICGYVFVRRFLMRRPNGDKVFIDDTGRRWRGRQCPDCNNKYWKLRLRSKRNGEVQPSKGNPS